MHREQRQRAQELLLEKGIECALFSSRPTIQWLTGFVPPIEPGAELFAGGPALLWFEDGCATLIVVDAHAAGAEGLDQEQDCTVITYLGYTIEQPIAGARRLAEALREVLRRSAAKGGRGGCSSPSSGCGRTTASRQTGLTCQVEPLTGGPFEVLWCCISRRLSAKILG